MQSVKQILLFYLGEQIYLAITVSVKSKKNNLMKFISSCEYKKVVSDILL